MLQGRPVDPPRRPGSPQGDGFIMYILRMEPVLTARYPQWGEVLTPGALALESQSEALDDMYRYKPFSQI